MALAAGTFLGPYEILAPLGAGGMGEVYRAHDTKLGRDVAIKILPDALAADPERIARFEREAKMLAALNHANIAHIHGLEESDGIRALVMELVEGPTLADRIAHGPLPADESLAIAKQIAEALEAAHEHGIVHRDLKPANIKVRPDGTVKVLDFGLAKSGASSADGGDLTHSPTAYRGTMAGVVLGTAPYMSPEQARGKPVDKRTDIWSFGCVLFEMLTGERAFAGETVSDSLAKVIEREPDWRALPCAIPDSVRRLVRRCLQKDPALRLHDIADARIEIGDALSSAAGNEAAPAASKSRTSAIAVLLAAAALAVIASAFWARSASERNRPAVHAIEFGVTFPNNYVPVEGVAISPDGRRIAASVWSDRGNIWMDSLDVDGSQPRPLAGGELANYPFWSPDSRTLAFFQGGQIVAMNADGGSRRAVARYGEGPARGDGGSWSRDNVILFSAGGKLFQVSATGGSQPSEVPIRGVSGRLTAPVFLPDRRHFVFCVDTASGGSMHLASLNDPHATPLGASACPGGFAPPDHVLFLRGGSIVAQRLDTRRLVLEGEAHVVASNVVRGSLGPWPVLTVSASDTGTIAFPAIRGGSSLGRLTWFDANDRVVGAIEPSSGDEEYLNPAICPTNDNLVAAHRYDRQSDTWHIWLIDGARGNAVSRLTTDAASDVDPAWSPDGREIVYASNRDGRRKFYRQPIAGGAPVALLDVQQFNDPIASDIGRDGRILFSDLQRSIWEFVPGASAPARLGSSASYGPHLSPDGKWLAYGSSQGGAFDLYVERFPGGAPRKKIATGVHPRWINGGKEIAYWTPPAGIVSTDLVLTDDDIRIGRTRTIVGEAVLTLIDARTAYDITRDGRRVLVRQQAGPPNPGIRVVVNWIAGLKRNAGE